ncbi:hypothetical protein C6496_09925 [Candidatus Poribacteria bacterium]|nr:MAG: hypothetical protein C6496_09925 [Candidatus Poribacteria bacterium]
MKKVITIPLLVLLLASFGCETKQRGPSNLSVGKSKLIDSGNALEAVELLEKAEQEEANKLEPRALLVIAYSHGLATGDAASLGVEAKFKNQRTQRIQELTDAEIRQILQILSTPSRVQRAGLQALVDKGPEVSTIILESLAKGRYPALHENFTEMLVQIGADGLDLILAELTDEMTPPALKIKLVQVLSEINDTKSIDALKTLQSQTDDAALAMEINTTLYQLGEAAYKQAIIDGLNHSDVAVRRAAAKAMVDIADISTKVLIAGLEDDDSEVVASLVKALAVHQDAAAVDPLVKILTSELNKDPKQAAIDTLDIYGQNKLTGGLAKPITMLLIGGTVSDPDNRLYLVQLLKREPFQRQLRALQSVEGLVDKLYQYHQNTETVGLVKRPLGELLDAVGK